ncbi:hypothetical protein CEQ36_15265 [Yersinia intermedia]|nr:hypothetical protein A6J67_23015 [Yersinia sp. FDAARGOS_228]AVL36829.1 hypothetical protein CEQ36_15265 [Yersinia intermedia]
MTPQRCSLHSYTRSILGPRSLRPLQAAFKSAPGRFVTRITDLSQLSWKGFLNCPFHQKNAEFITTGYLPITKKVSLMSL